MKNIIVDVEADGGCAGIYSMIEVGAVVLDDKLDKTFSINLAPIFDIWIPEALAVSGYTREETLKFTPAEEAIKKFYEWVKSVGNGDRVVLISDNPSFDFAFVHYYFWRYCGENPFGHSARRIGDFYAGLEGNWFAANKWKHLRKTRHSHVAVEDATANAEALLAMQKIYNVNII
jgi:DNA polymerase III epsilon subunit-like protein